MADNRRLFTGSHLVIATHNPGKLREIAALLQQPGLQLSAAGSLGLPEPEETGQTFAANAILKAQAAAQASGIPALADDSGLSVAALAGAPGIYSARWAGPEKDFTLAMDQVAQKIAQATGGPVASPAHFTCALCLAWPDGHYELVEGHIHGEICWPPRGTNGFGYDPIFQPTGHTVSFGEMAPDAKHAISHRAVAFALLRPLLQAGGPG